MKSLLPQQSKSNSAWNDWHWQLENTISCKEILDRLPRSISREILPVDSEFPSRITPYYLNLIDWHDVPDDPIYKQSFPDVRELENSTETAKFTEDDPLHEEDQMPVPYLIRRYQDRAVLLTTNHCAVHCRFCLRKRKWKKGAACHSINDNELAAVGNFLQENPSIREVLISGGDPLMLETTRLQEILWRISQIPSINILRLGTRLPVVLPMRVDDKLVSMLKDIPGLWLATHFNHPRELTTEAVNACRKLNQAGIPIINQTVLLKDVNDRPEILQELFTGLAAHRILPHYLFHIDPVTGNRHFSTGIQAGLEIIRSLRSRLSSISTPQFAFDLPEGGGKIPLLPDYKTPNGYQSIDGRIIDYPY